LVTNAQKHKRAVGVICVLTKPTSRCAASGTAFIVLLKGGDTIDLLLITMRDTKVALRFLRQAIRNNGTPLIINIDKSGANTAAIEYYTGASIENR